MSRYFFDFRQSGVRVPDTQGVEFASTEQAYLEAFRAAQEMWSELLAQRQDPRLCMFEVRDEAGNVLFLFPFQEVLDACTGRRQVPLRRTCEQLTHTSQYAKRVSAEFIDELSNMRDMLQDSRALLLEMA